MPYKILVVDDDEDIVHILKTTLVKRGYEVMTAPDGVEALKLLEGNAPDLIVSDLTMPVMNGWQFSMKVRSKERFAKIPIIIVSGLLEQESMPQEYESATFYLPKPYDIFKLLDKIKELLKEPPPA